MVCNHFNNLYVRLWTVTAVKKCVSRLCPSVFLVIHNDLIMLGRLVSVFPLQVVRVWSSIQIGTFNVSIKLTLTVTWDSFNFG